MRSTKIETLATDAELDEWMKYAGNTEHALRDGHGALWLATTDTDGDWQALRWCRDGLDCENGPGAVESLTELPRPLTVLGAAGSGDSGCPSGESEDGPCGADPWATICVCRGDGSEKEPGGHDGDTRRRSDGRVEVADTAAATAAYGCPADDWCILAAGHPGECCEGREVWAGPDMPYAADTGSGGSISPAPPTTPTALEG